MLWRQCWCQKCFQSGGLEKGTRWLQLLVSMVGCWCITEQWSAVQNCWAGSGVGWVRLSARWKSLQRGRGCELPAGAAVTSCPVVSPRAEPHHMAALAWIPASSGAFHLQIWARLHCLFDSGFFFCPSILRSICYLCCLDLYRPLFSRWLLISRGFYKTWWPRGEETV